MFTQKSVFKPNFRHFLLVRAANLCVGNGSPSREIPGHVDMDLFRPRNFAEERKM